MSSVKPTYDLQTATPRSVLREDSIEYGFIGILQWPKCRVKQVKQIVNCIHQDCGHSYVWRNTGSAHAITSFKASALLKANADILKRLFVVERNDNGQDKRCDPSRNLNLWSEAVCQTQ